MVSIKDCICLHKYDTVVYLLQLSLKTRYSENIERNVCVNKPRSKDLLYTLCYVSELLLSRCS